MALWLDLIPRLHHSDDLDARYHQLDNFADRSSFDEQGTRLPEGAELALLRSLAAARTDRANASNPPAATDTTTASSGRRRRATTTTEIPAAATRSQIPTPAATLGSRRSGVGLMSLSVTVGIGCGLLVVNAAVLTALYCKRGRLSKMRQQLALLAPPGESAQLVDADRSAYTCRQTADVDESSSSLRVGVLDGGISSASLVPAPPPPPEPSPRRRTTLRRSQGNSDHIALTSAATNADSDSSRVNTAILMSVTSPTPCVDANRHVASSSNDTVV